MKSQMAWNIIFQYLDTLSLMESCSSSVMDAVVMVIDLDCIRWMTGISQYA